MTAETLINEPFTRLSSNLLSRRSGIFPHPVENSTAGFKGMLGNGRGEVIGSVMNSARLRYRGMKQFKEDKPLVRTTRLRIGGMTCGGCVHHVTKALNDLTGVVNVDVDLQKNEATVKRLPDSVDQGRLVAAVQDAGFQARVSESSTESAKVVARSAPPGCSTACCCER